jgi:hypothetical protein
MPLHKRGNVALAGDIGHTDTSGPLAGIPTRVLKAPSAEVCKVSTRPLPPRETKSSDAHGELASILDERTSTTITAPNVSKKPLGR